VTREPWCAAFKATRAAGTLIPPGRPGFVRGTLVQVALSAVCGEALARTLPAPHSVGYGAAAGLTIGLVNIGSVRRKLPAIRALPVLPQFADHVAFGWRLPWCRQLKASSIRRTTRPRNLGLGVEFGRKHNVTGGSFGLPEPKGTGL
jgi:hypothetical protein